MADVETTIGKVVRLNKDDGTHYGWAFFCPACRCGHFFDLQRWTFNGDVSNPTFSPSLLHYENGVAPRCHLFVRDGQIEYCGDCTHEFAGKTIPMEERFRWFDE